MLDFLLYLQYIRGYAKTAIKSIVVLARIAIGVKERLHCWLFVIGDSAVMSAQFCFFAVLKFCYNYVVKNNKQDAL
jgi:hypothetical protein